jgi:hypothetical protein
MVISLARVYVLKIVAVSAVFVKKKHAVFAQGPCLLPLVNGRIMEYYGFAIRTGIHDEVRSDRSVSRNGGHGVTWI